MNEIDLLVVRSQRTPGFPLLSALLSLAVECSLFTAPSTVGD